MHLKGLFKKENQPVRHQNQAEAPNVPDGLYTKCESCHEMILTEDFTQNAYVCPKCGHYMKIGAYERIEMVFDAQTFEEWDEEFTGGNPCHFKGYEEKLGDLQRDTGLNEAVITGKGKIPENVGVITTDVTEQQLNSLKAGNEAVRSIVGFEGSNEDTAKACMKMYERILSGEKFEGDDHNVYRTIKPITTDNIDEILKGM